MLIPCKETIDSAVRASPTSPSRSKISTHPPQWSLGHAPAHQPSGTVARPRNTNERLTARSQDSESSCRVAFSIRIIRDASLHRLCDSPPFNECLQVMVGNLIQTFAHFDRLCCVSTRACQRSLRFFYSRDPIVIAAVSLITRISPMSCFVFVRALLAKVILPEIQQLQ